MSGGPREARAQELWDQVRATTRPDARMRALKELVLQAPEDPEAQYEYGRELSRSGRDDALASRHLHEVLRLDARHVDARVTLGIIHHRRSEYDQAAGMYGAAVSADPKNARGWLNFGALEMDRRDYRAAAKAYKRAVEIRPKDPRARSKLARALHALERYDDAIVQWNVALRYADGDPGVLRGLAQSLGAVGDENAIDAYREAVKANPESVSLRRDLAALLQSADDASGAEAALREGVDVNPSSSRLWEALAEYLVAQDRTGDAVAALREALVRTAGAESARLALVKVLCDLDRLDEAARELRPVVLADPANASARRLMAAIQACQGYYEESAATAQIALKTQPSVAWPRMLVMEVASRPEKPMAVPPHDARPLPSHRGYALTVRGILKLALGQHEPAASLLEQALQAAPETAVPRVGRALVYMDRGNMEAAYAELRTASILEPRSSHVQHLFGEAAFHTGKYEEAAAAFQNALACGETDPLLLGLTHFCRARAFRKRRMGREAIECYMEAQRLVPEHYPSFFGCAVALQEAGRHDEALEHYERAIALSPGHAPALTGLASCLEATGRAPEAVDAYRAAVRADRRYALPRYNLAVLIERTGDPHEVASLLRSYVKLAPKAANIDDARRRLTVAELRASGALRSPEVLNEPAQEAPDDIFLDSADDQSLVGTDGRGMPLDPRLRT